MNILILTIVFPLISFALLAISHGSWSKNLSSILGISSIGLAFLITIYTGINFYSNRNPLRISLWNWISVDNFNISFDLLLDGLSLTMLFVITIVGFLVHIFSSWYMRDEDDFSRFFAYTNLFIASIIVLILANNLLLMYLGWECVGFCSYLLISFYYKNPKNYISAIKAFIITRIGDIFFAFALFILFSKLKTFDLFEIMKLTTNNFVIDSNAVWWITLMLLFSAISKSAQFPLHTWLTEAMVGPTPASALIHSATMVTAGVYLIARTHNLFLIASENLHLVSTIGIATIVVASFSALFQNNIKRILAYSTMSHIGYMFLALGVQAWNAAIVHLMMHAFFKALLFLSSGSVILSCNHEQNIFRMGGLRKFLPLVYICFVIGSATLPLVTAGFFSKDKILAIILANEHKNTIILCLISIFLTSLYTFRTIFIVFHGKEKIYFQIKKGITYYLPLVILLIFSTFIGTLIVPPLNGVLPDNTELDHNRELILKIISSFISILGIVIASWLWLSKRIVIANSKICRILTIWCYKAWGFDWLYNIIFVKPFLFIAWLLKNDPLNALMDIFAAFFCSVSKKLSYIENGHLSWYTTSIGIGTVILLLMLIIN